MRVFQRIAFAVWVAAILICAVPLPTATAQANSAATSDTIACSALEVHPLAQPAVTVVVFHQRDIPTSTAHLRTDLGGSGPA